MAEAVPPLLTQLRVAIRTRHLQPADGRSVRALRAAVRASGHRGAWGL